jgi:hypothetical protein
MAKIDAKVTSYSVEVMRSSDSSQVRALGLTLEGNLQADLLFVPVPPATWVVIGPTFATVSLPVSDFDDMYHLLQTERPVFFNAAVETSPSFQVARLSTGPERVGQGLSDPGTGI